MTSIYDIYLFYLFEIICLNIFSKFLSFVHVTSKLSILSNYAEHPKKLLPYYIEFLFLILKSPHLTDQPTYLEKMTSVQRKIHLA